MIHFAPSNQLQDKKMQYINISGYQFKETANLVQLQCELRTLAERCNLKGTLLLGTEGINAFASGDADNIEIFISGLQKYFPGIAFKKSASESQPFDKLCVKIKPEIVTFGVPNISPEKNPAPNLSPETFHAWLKDNKDIVILDTRNEYEVDMGTFRNAVDLNIRNFREFPEAVKRQLPESYKQKTIVTFCTGGIRCEKAAPYLIQQGFEKVYQLEGGILTYFEKMGSEFFEGDCFVFDKRLAVDTHLKETLP